MAHNDMLDICTYLTELVKEAGNIILTARPTSLTTSIKKNSLIFLYAVSSTQLTDQ